MITNVLFENKFKPLVKINPIDVSSVEDVFIKNGSLNQILSIPKVSGLLKEVCPYLEKNHKFTSFDLKIKNVEEGKFPSIYGWHFDGSPLLLKEEVKEVS